MVALMRLSIFLEKDSARDSAGPGQLRTSASGGKPPDTEAVREHGKNAAAEKAAGRRKE